jgi:hypothetical protein
MRAPTFRFHSRDRGQALNSPVAVAPVSPPGSTAAGPGIGAILSLGGLGIAAVATVVAFFGIGLALLIEPPARVIRSGPSAAAAVEAPSAVVLPAAAPAAAGVGQEAPAARADTHSPLHKAGESLASARNAAAATPPTIAQPRSEPTLKTAMTAAPATAVPGPSPAARTPEQAVHGPTAASPSVPSPPPQAETKPVPAAVAPEPRPPAPPSVVSAAPPANEAAVVAPPSAAEISALLTQGDDAFRGGDLTSARLYYLRAFAVGEGRGALGIGATYDPLFLRRFHLWLARADPAEARAWYLRARNLGSSEAGNRLAKLKARWYR